MTDQNINIQSQDTAYRGIRRYYHKDWNIEAYDIERKRIKNKEYTELGIKGHSIYFLYGEDAEGNLKIYVGRSSETEDNVPLFTRLSQHDNSSTEYYREIWDSVIAISFKNLSFDEMRNLENYFYKALLSKIKLNSTKPDTSIYKYENIKHKVEYIKAFVNYILKENVFKEQEKQEETKEVSRLNCTDEELANQGKRLVDKDFETVTEVQTPVDIIEKMLDLLPASIWNPRTKFLDPACKSGEYLKAIFNRLLTSPLYKGTKYENMPDRILHIISEQLYGIALTETSYKLTRKNFNKNANIVKIDNFDFILKCFNNIQKNYKADESRTVLLRLGITENTLISFLRHKFGEDEEMTFDVIIGNPPYQENNGGGKDGMSGNTLYDKFIDTALDNADNVCMIVKDNWMTYKGLESTREKIINTGLVELIDYPIPSELFNNVAVSVNILLTSKDYKGPTHFTEIRNGNITQEYNEDIRGFSHIPTCKEEISITEKIKANTKEWFSRHVESAYPFGIKSNEVYSDGCKLITSVAAIGDYNTPIMFLEGKQASYKYVSRESLFKNTHIIDNYKVICGLQLNRNGRIITNMHGLVPGHICSGSFGLLFNSPDKIEAFNAYKYIRTKFFRCILYWCIDTKCTVASYRFDSIPDQNFINNSVIDWSKSITEIDQQLYRIYGLDEQEIQYIENTMESLDTQSAFPRYTVQDAAAALVNQMVKNDN